MASVPAPTRDSRPRTPRYHPLVIVLVAACAGILADRWLDVPLGLSWWGAVGMWAVWLVLWRRRWLHASSFVLLGTVACTAAAWHHSQWSLFAENDLANCARSMGEPAAIEAVVIDRPQRLLAPEPDPMRAIAETDRTQTIVAITGIRDGAQWLPCTGRARLTVDGHLLGIHTGDRLRVFGQLAALGPPNNPGQFDFTAYERSQRRRCRLWAECPDCVTRLAAGPWWSLNRVLERVRIRADRLLAENLDPSSYSLATALLLGMREELGREGTDPFLETGTIHILSISGLHVGIIAAVIVWLMRLLAVSQRRSLLTVAVLTTLYTLLTGAQPPAVRALILVLVMCGSQILYRPSLPMNSLAGAALVVLALNPTHLFNVGVQLSFLAVAGLTVFTPEWFGLERKSDRLEQLIQESQGWVAWAWNACWRGAWRMTQASAIIWLLTLPLIMARFHLLQPAALVLNALLWLPVPLALTSGCGVIGFSGLAPPLAWLCSAICELSIGTLNGFVHVARGLPGSHVWVPGPADWWLAGFYGALGLAVAFPRLRPPRRWSVAILAGWSAVGFGVHFLESPRGQLEATFLSVGHGSAVVLRLPDGATMLYDAGELTSPQSAADTIAGFLWSKGLTHIDAVVLSHADADHYNAVPGLLRRFSVGAIYVSPVMFDNPDNPALEALRETIRASGVRVGRVSAGDLLEAGPGCRIEVVHPPRRGVVGGDNSNSIVLAIEYQGRRILLPGDLDPPGLYDVLAEEPWDCDVLMAPHHGSRGSDPPRLAAWCRPDYVVISGGHRWQNPDTMAQFRAVGAQVLHTAQMGAVSFVIRDSQLERTSNQREGFRYAK